MKAKSPKKVRITAIYEYVPDPEDYEEGSTLAEMADYDERENHYANMPDIYEDALVDVKYEVAAD